MKKGIIRRYFWYSIFYGAVTAVVFRLIAPVFVEFKTPALEHSFTAICFIVGVTVGLSSYVIGRSTLMKVLDELHAFSRELAAGDLRARIGTLSEDRYGRLSGHLNGVAAKLQSDMQVIQESSNEIATAVEQQTASTLSLAENSQKQVEMQNIIIESSRSNNEKMEEVSFNVDILTNTSAILLNRINELSKVIVTSSENSREAIELAQNVSGRITASGSDLESTSRTIREIERSSGEMAGIMNFINDIADKINLLSLNAAIESARAGDAGRGFAVVAEEISKLADQTGSSIKNIDQLIKTNNDEIKKGISSINSIVAAMNQIISDTSNVIAIIQKMFDIMQIQLSYNQNVNREVQTIMKMIEETNISFDVHKKSSEKIDRSIVEIGDIGISHTSASEELAAAAQEIGNMVGRLNGIVKNFKV